MNLIPVQMQSCTVMSLLFTCGRSLTWAELPLLGAPPMLRKVSRSPHDPKTHTHNGTTTCPTTTEKWFRLDSIRSCLIGSSKGN